jgi:hypothetical protein
MMTIESGGSKSMIFLAYRSASFNLERSRVSAPIPRILPSLAGRRNRIDEACMTSEQRRNVMACRKLAQQRVLRIMQQQTAEQAARVATERAAEREGLTQVRTRWPNSEKRDL